MTKETWLRVIPDLQGLIQGPYDPDLGFRMFPAIDPSQSLTSNRFRPISTGMASCQDA